MNLQDLLHVIVGNRGWWRRARRVHPIRNAVRPLRAERLEQRTLLSVGAVPKSPPENLPAHVLESTLEPSADTVAVELSPRLRKIDADLGMVVGTELAELHALYEEAGGRMESVSLPAGSPLWINGDRVAVEAIAIGDLSVWAWRASEAWWIDIGQFLQMGY